MDILERIQLLQSYRKKREETNRNPVGEATGRNYIPIPPELIEEGRKASGVAGFVRMFEIMLSFSPVVIRPGELIVGNYYFMLPYDIIPITPPVDYGKCAKHGAMPVPPSGHSVVNISRGLKLGWQGMLDLIAQSRQKFQDGSPEADYLDGEKVVVSTIQKHIRAYGTEAERLSRENPEFSTEYLEISDRCFRLATDPPQSFHDALQWYYFFVIFERSTSSGMGSVRLDQTFYSYYKHDMQSGTLGEEKAQLLFECLFMKEPLFWSIGGMDVQGKDAVNELSYLAITAYDTVGGSSNLSVRWHPNIDTQFMDHVSNTLANHGTGVPIVVNDNVIIPSLVKFGFPLKLARNYCFAGCFWYVVPGKEYTYHDLPSISGVRPLIRALEATKDGSVTTFDDLWQRYTEYVKDAVATLVDAYAIIDPWMTEHYPEMVVSLLMDDCLEKGRDFNNCGPEYNLMTVLFVGLANVANSLYAIKKNVFEDHKLTLDEIRKSCEQNYSGHGKVWGILNNSPKYGNGISEVDEIAVRVAEQFKNCLIEFRNSKGYQLRPSFYSYHRHTYEGTSLPATPDGRKAGMPLALSANPSSGTTKEGITAVIQSMTKIKMDDTAGGPVHIHLHRSEKNLLKNTIKSLILTSFGLGAMHLNINVVDGKILYDAINHPEEYTDLVIRVTGYSARFTQLDRKLQEEIAARNSY